MSLNFAIFRSTMFESEEWDDDGVDQPHLSALSRALVMSNKSKQKQKQKQKPMTGSDPSTSRKVKDKKKSKKAKSLVNRIVRSVDEEIDKHVNSPSASQKLLSQDNDDVDLNDSDLTTQGIENKKKNKKSKLVKRLKSTAAVVVDTKKKIERSLSDTSLKEPGHLLKMGIKFSPQDAFPRCVKLEIYFKIYFCVNILYLDALVSRGRSKRRIVLVLRLRKPLLPRAMKKIKKKMKCLNRLLHRERNEKKMVQTLINSEKCLTLKTVLMRRRPLPPPWLTLKELRRRRRRRLKPLPPWLMRPEQSWQRAGSDISMSNSTLNPPMQQ